MLNYQYPFLKSSPFLEPIKTQNTWFDESQFVNVDSSAQWPVSIDAQSQGMSDLVISWLIFL